MVSELLLNMPMVQLHHSVSIDRFAEVTENLNLQCRFGGSTSYVVSVIPNISVNSGAAVTVGVGKTMIIDVLQVGDL